MAAKRTRRQSSVQVAILYLAAEKWGAAIRNAGKPDPCRSTGLEFERPTIAGSSARSRHGRVTETYLQMGDALESSV